MFDYAIQVVEKEIQKLEFKKTKKHLEKDNYQKKINHIDTYFNLQKQLKSNKTDGLFYLWMTITSGIGGIVFPPLLVVTIAFMILTAMNTKDTLRMKKRLETKYSNVSHLSKEELLQEKERLVKKINNMMPECNEISNKITKYKFNLQELNACKKLEKKSSSEAVAIKVIEDYLESQSELPIEEYFAKKVNYPNGSSNQVRYQEQPKQYKKVG